MMGHGLGELLSRGSWGGCGANCCLSFTCFSFVSTLLVAPLWISLFGSTSSLLTGAN
jgi:hypothetical protein